MGKEAAPGSLALIGDDAAHDLAELILGKQGLLLQGELLHFHQYLLHLFVGGLNIDAVQPDADGVDAAALAQDDIGQLFQKAGAFFPPTLRGFTEPERAPLWTLRPRLVGAPPEYTSTIFQNH